MNNEKLIKILNKKEMEYKRLLEKYNNTNNKSLRVKLSNDLINLEHDMEHIQHIIKNSES